MVVQGGGGVHHHQRDQREGGDLMHRRIASPTGMPPETGRVRGRVKYSITGAQQAEVPAQPSSGTATIRA